MLRSRSPSPLMLAERDRKRRKSERMQLRKGGRNENRVRVPPPPGPSKFIVKVPEWTSREELELIRLTAQSVAQHGYLCWLDLMKTENMETLLGFMIVHDTRFYYFTMLAGQYSGWTPTMISSSWQGPTSVEGFALLDSPEFVLLPLRARHLPTEEEKAESLKIGKSELVPEFQFLAHHPASSTIRVFVPNSSDNSRVINITVHSLSENVASLKEKIAAQETQIPVDKQKLWGKAGVLEDNKSLAHYNVGPQDILLLFWCL